MSGQTQPDHKVIQRAKAANSNHKQTLQKIHRILDGYIEGRGASACMDEIKKIIGRAS
jgi:hypothetical protein